MARMQKEINWEMVELYIRAGCSQANIARSLFIDADTLRARVKEKYEMDYSVFSAALQSEGKMLIEAKQHKKAMEGYWPALQWLGKIRCEQREPELTNQMANNQAQLDQSHLIMQLQHELAEEKAKNAHKSKTE